VIEACVAMIEKKKGRVELEFWKFGREIEGYAKENLPKAAMKKAVS
jgi:hypothetical protein